MLRVVLSLSLLALTAPPADEAQPKPGSPNSGVAVSPSGNLTGLVRYQDYPADALRKGEQGTVAVLLTVNERGEVAGCTVETSSGSPTLDTRTCRVLSERAKFEPAKDKTGRPVAGAFRQRISWRIEETASPSEDWFALGFMTINSTTQAVTCKMEFGGAMQVADPNSQECDGVDGLAADIRSSGMIPAGMTAFVSLEQRFFRGRKRGADLPPPPSGNVVLARQVLDVSIAIDGKIASCKQVSWQGSLETDAPPCVDFKKFTPPTDAAGRRIPIQATIVNGLYVRFGKLT